MPADAPIKAEDILLGQTYCKYATTTAIQHPKVFFAGTISTLQSRIAWAVNSGMLMTPISNKSVVVNPFNNNRQFIKLNQAFLKELEVHKEDFEGQGDYVLQEKMKISADALLNFAPDKISLEITSDKSIFYKLIKGDFKLFVEHFLIDEFDGAEEAMVTIYKNDENILNFGGTLSEVIEEINEILVPQFIAAVELA